MNTMSIKEIIDKLTEIISIHTKIEKSELDLYENLTEMGVDSIIFTQIKNDVINTYGVDIPFSKIYEEINSIDRIAHYVKANCKAYSGAYVKKENREDSKSDINFESALKEVAAAKQDEYNYQDALIEKDLDNLFYLQLKIVEKQIDVISNKYYFNDKISSRNNIEDENIKCEHIEFRESLEEIALTDQNKYHYKDDLRETNLKDLFSYQLKIIEKQIDIISGRHNYNDNLCSEDIIIEKVEQLDDNKEISLEIRKDEEVKEFPLTKEQQNILAQCEMSENNLAFNEAIAIRIKGKLDVTLLEESLNKVIERHEALRTVIDTENKKQIILNSMLAKIEIIEKEEINTEQVVKDIISEAFILNDKLFRIKAIKESEEQYILIFVVHHIIADGWSMGILYNEMKEYYNSNFTEKRVELKEPVQFREYVKIKDELISLNKLNREAEDNEKSHLKMDNFLDLLQSFSVNSKEFTGARYEFTEDIQMLKALRKISVKNNTSIFNTMLSLFMAFLSKVTKHNMITVGVPFAGQNIINAESLIGNCVEMIGVSLPLEGSNSLNDVSYKLKTYFQGVENKRYFNSANADRTYNVVFSMNRRVFDYDLFGTEIEYIPVEIYESKYDLFVSVLEFGNKLIIRFDYNKGVLSEATIKRWSTYFKLILKARIEENNKSLDDISIISDEEMSVIINNYSTFKFEDVKNKLREDISSYGIAQNADARVFVLDNNMQIAGMGLLGDIYIGADEVEIYNTNKIGRLLENGDLEVLGEEKRQVRIKDRNISLFKIEGSLRNNFKIADAACEYDCEASEIIAYIIESEKINNAAEIVMELRKELPMFMMPDKFIKVTSLQERNDGEVIEYKEELTKTEEKVISIWMEILDINRVATEDNFFNVGGNSLKAMKLLSKIQTEFNKRITIKDLFEQPTVKKLSEILDSKDTYSNRENTILKIDHNEYYEASSVQKRMYALHKLDKESLNYNIPFVMIVNGGLEKEDLDKIINRIIERHETLRTYFEEINGKVILKIAKSFRTKIKYEEKPDNIDEKDYLDGKIKEFVRPFDLNKLPLLRVEMLKVKEKRHLILFDFHHIIFDGASSAVLAKDFVSIYNGIELPKMEIEYKDYAAWINNFCASEGIRKQEEYWKNVFYDGVPVLNVQTDFSRPVNQTFKGRNLSFNINEEVSKKIDSFCKNYNVTPYMFFLAGINILLSKYSRQEDIVVGTVIEGRNSLAVSDLIGMFVNTLPMRNKPRSEKTFIEFLNDVKQNTLDVFDNSEYQFESLVNLIDAPRDSSRHPLFDVMFVFQNNQIQELNTGDLEISSYIIKPESSRFDLSFEVRQESENYKCSIEFNTDLFKSETIERLSTHLGTLFANILNKPEEKIYKIEILNDSERNKLLFDFNDTKADYPKNKMIHQLFEEQVEKKPNNIAVVYGEEKLTYRELNLKANQLAATLRKKGVLPDSIVGIMVERSVEMIIGILGILKAGGGYLPINISYPKERIEYILNDSGVKILLVKGDIPSGIDFDGETVNMMDEAINNELDLNPVNINKPQDIAYIIYTSGTTGKPKGTVLEHKNVVRLFFNDKALFDFNENDVWTMFHSYCFDFSVWEMYGALLYGGKLIIIPEAIAQDTKKYLEILEKQKVTVLNQTPSAFYNLSSEEMKRKDNNLAIRYIIFGGEELKPRKLKEWKNKYPVTRLINMYGITETTVHVTYKELTDKDIEIGISNIGRPIPTLSNYIVDSHMELLPIGVAGELCVAGEGLARGYLNRPELTEERFIPNPFIAGEKMYRSGDLARWLSNGDLEYLGRIDHQVKIRGHRIEIGEIEATLNEYYGMKDSVVTVKKGVLGDSRLVAYVIPETDDDSLITKQAQEENLEQVEKWEEVFDGVYSKEAELSDKMFNIIGWDSSYTGKPIPEDEMAEWLNTTIERILRYKPNKVLEIGCGTGMILYRIAPSCSEYCATDLSAEAINYVGKVIEKDSMLRDKVSLINTSADNFSAIKGQYDFAIFNSIVQYFPSMEYLMDVLEKTINTLKNGSIIFMGDIRSFALLEAFHTSIALFKNTADFNISDLKYYIQKNIAMDSELVIDPLFFYALKEHFPRITHVDILYKKGKENNELTVFRYDAVLHIGTDIECLQEISYNWQKEKLDIESVKNILLRDNPERLRILDVPNSRTVRLISEVDVLSRETNLKILREVAVEVDNLLTDTGVEFEEFRQLSNTEYDVEILWAGPRKDNCYDVVFTRRGEEEESKKYAYSDLGCNIEPCCKLSTFTSNPLKAKYLKNFVVSLKNYLKATLPEYMIPSNFIQMEKFPMTPNGKIDKKMLPEPDINRLSIGNREEARNDIEEKIVEIWCKVLGVDTVGINDNFFELGGHSLNATVVISEIHKELNVDIPLKQLFMSPTIKQLSVYIQNSGENSYETIEKCKEKEHYGTSSAQKRVYTLQQLKKESTAYNMPAVFELEGDVDVERIENAFKKLTKRHEALRTCFEMIDGEIIQKIDNKYEFKLEIRRETEKDIEAITRNFIRSFKLESLPLFRVELVETAGKSILLMDMHHIISDGVSISILIKEFSMLYNGIEPEPLRLQYKDFAKWQNKFLKSEKIKKQREYWISRFNDETPVLNLPYDYERPSVQSYEGDNVSFFLDEETTRNLRKIAKENESTMHMVMLSIFNILLSKYSEQDCIVVGIPVAGRPHADLQNIIGMFVNTLAFKNNPNAEKTFKEFLREVKENSIKAYENQSYQFEELIEIINVKREKGRNPIFDVMFNMVNADYSSVIELDGLTLKPCTIGSKISKFDLTLIAAETNKTIEMNFEYCSKLFKRNTIERAVKDIKLIIDIILSNIDIEIGKISLRSEEEQQYVMQEEENIKNIKNQDFAF